ncbi:MAG: hypothetical protein MJZ03_04070 [archaeon]|nr:hypothetical protein [archaeon]
MGQPNMPNLEALLQAGIDPHTGLPLKCCSGSMLKESVEKLLRVVDRQDAINRFEWSGLPEGLSADLIERILYYRGQGIFFRMRADDRYYFLPYALCGTIDIYGRWKQVTPLPFNGKMDTDKAWIQGLIKNPVYDTSDIVDVDDACVIIRDYTSSIDQTIIPREVLNKPLVGIESDCIPFLRTALLNSTGVQGIRVADEESSGNVLAASHAIDNAALTGNKYVPIVGALDFQDLTSGKTTDASQFLMCMQSIDNLRLQMLGIKNGGIFQKTEHILQTEQDLNTGSDSITLKDALKQRQDACELINAIFGLNVSVKPIKQEQPASIDNIEIEEEEEDVLSND